MEKDGIDAEIPPRKMEKNEIYAEMRRRIKEAFFGGKNQTVVLVFVPKRYNHTGIFGPLADLLFGLKIDPVPEDDQACERALLQLAHDGFNIAYSRAGDPQAPYCKVVVNGISSLNETRV